MRESVRIVQLLPCLAYGDAIGNDTLAIRDVLTGMGYDTAIYAEVIDRRLPVNTAQSVELMPSLTDEDVILYHGSTGSKLNYDFPQMRGRKVMIYHNITPHEMFAGYDPSAERNMIDGIQGMKYLSDKVDHCIADSEFNRQELLRMGFTCPIDVCPIIIPFADYEKRPDQAVLRRYRNDDSTNLLFVGRVAPNKKQEDIIRAFSLYRRHYDPHARLFLVGSYDGMEKYYDRLRRYVDRLALQQAVFFTGKIRFEAILSYYRLADAFVCMSEHEGFCVPLVEAMYFDVPILAYNSTAIPDTLGGSGVLLPEKDPALAAACIDRVLRDDAARAHLIKGQRRRLEDFSYETVSARLKGILKSIVGEG